MHLRTLAPVLMLAGLASAGTQTNLKVGDRTAIVVVPSGYSNPPLVISMHGIGIPNSWNQTMMKFESYADTARDKFVVVYPQAEGGSWDLNGDKDVKFILAIIDSMYNRYRIDRNRVYASGFSMGGMMSWYLSCKIPDKIAAIVPGNGYPLGGMSGCSEVRHVPALQIHGTADDFVSYSGFVTKFLPSQLSRYGCPATAARTKPYPANSPTSKSFLDAWTPCTKNGLTSEIRLLSVDGMIHDWATPGKLNASDDLNYKGKPFDVDGTAEAWNWMKRHSLNGSTPIVTVPAHRDTIFNGRFGSSAVGWSFNVWSGSAQGSVVNGEYRAQIDGIGSNAHDIQLIQNGLVLEQGKSYEVKFDAYSTSIRTMEANVEKDTDPWTSYLPGPRSFDLTTVKTPYSYTFTMTQPTDSNGRVSFNLGSSTGSVFLDNISIQPGKPTSIHAAKHPGGSVRIVRSGASQLQVEFGAPHGTAISLGIFDLSGKRIRSERFRARSGAIQSWTSDLSGMSGGIYVLAIDIDGEAAHRSSFVLGD